MFIYADETGNSGRNIFDRQEIYRCGAIFSLSDIDSAAASVIRPFLAEHGVNRIHAHELHESVVVDLAEKLMDALDASGVTESRDDMV